MLPLAQQYEQTNLCAGRKYTIHPTTGSGWFHHVPCRLLMFLVMSELPPWHVLRAATKARASSAATVVCVLASDRPASASLGVPMPIRARCSCHHRHAMSRVSSTIRNCDEPCRIYRVYRKPVTRSPARMPATIRRGAPGRVSPGQAASEPLCVSRDRANYTRLRLANTERDGRGGGGSRREKARGQSVRLPRETREELDPSIARDGRRGCGARRGGRPKTEHLPARAEQGSR